jgi:hypothetical protein
MKILKFFAAVILIVTTAMLLPYVLAAVGISIAALFTPSPIMNELRKKAGSDVFSKNHYGAFIRKRVKGTNPKSTKQINVRSNLTSLAKGWKALGSADMAAWIAYAKNFTLKNRLGQSIQLTGETWYLKLSRILQSSGVAPVAAPPSTSAVPPGLADTPGMTIVSGTSVAVTLGTALPAGAWARIFMSAPFSAGRVYNSNYRYVGTMKPADTTSKDVTTAYVAAFGRCPLTGEKIFMKLIATDAANGLSNQAQAVAKVV